MNQFEKITIQDAFGKDKEYELITTIVNEKTNTKYIVYKDLDDNGEDIDLYISRIDIDNDKEIISEIEDETEWNHVCQVLDDMFNNEG